MPGLRSAIALSLALPLTAAAGAGAATSDTDNVTSQVNAGTTLSVAVVAPLSFNVTLNGVDQIVNYTLPVTVVDARGGTLGWNLTVGSTTFNDGATTTGHTFGASTITG